MKKAPLLKICLFLCCLLLGSCFSGTARETISPLDEGSEKDLHVMPSPTPSPMPIASATATNARQENARNEQPESKQTPTPSSLNESVVYIQDPINLGIYFYSNVHLSEGELPLSPEQLISQPGVGGLGDVSLSFANFRNLIAYYDKENNVWLATLMNDNPVKIFSNLSPSYLVTFLTWTPDDKHLIIDVQDPDQKDYIYHLDSAEVEEWNYKCDRLAFSPKTQNIAIWCTPLLINEQFAALELDGTIWFSQGIPQDELLISDLTEEQKNLRFSLFPLYWNLGWSSNGEHLALFDRTGSFMIMDKQGTIVFELPNKAYWLTDYFQIDNDIPGKPIQWSENGKRLLIFAAGDSKFPCPEVQIPDRSVQGKVPNSACWQVLDAETGELLWSEADLVSVIEKVDGKVIEYGHGDAALSPNGEMLAIFTYVNGYNPRFFINEVSSNEILLDERLFVYKLRWGPK